MLAAAGSIVAAVAVFAIATVVLVRHELRASLDTALRQRAQDVAQLAVSAPAVLDDPGALEGNASGRDIVVEVIDARGPDPGPVADPGRALLPQDRLARGALVAGRTGYEDASIDGRPFRLYDAPIASGVGGPAAGGAVLVGSDTSDISSTLGHLGLVVGIAGRHGGAAGRPGRRGADPPRAAAARPAGGRGWGDRADGRSGAAVARRTGA